MAKERLDGRQNRRTDSCEKTNRRDEFCQNEMNKTGGKIKRFPKKRTTVPDKKKTKRNMQDRTARCFVPSGPPRIEVGAS